MTPIEKLQELVDRLPHGRFVAACVAAFGALAGGVALILGFAS